MDASPFSNINILQGVTDKGGASVFCVKERETKGPYKYKLLLLEKEAERLYVARSDKRKTGKGSIEVGGGHTIKFSLDAKEGGSGLTVTDWETTPCRVNIAPQKKSGYVGGFLGYNERQNLCEFVGSGDSEAAGKMWLHCKLEPVEADSGAGFAKAPKGMKVKPPVIVRPCIDSSDDEYQFGE